MTKRQKRKVLLLSLLCVYNSSTQQMTKRQKRKVLLLSLLCVLSSNAFQPQSSTRPLSSTRRQHSTRIRRPGSAAGTTMFAATGVDEAFADLIAREKQPTPENEKERREEKRSVLATRRRAVTELEDEARDKQDQFFLLLAFAPSLLAFLSWEDISRTLAIFLDTYGAIGRAVDGGQFATNLLRPTITGVVVPVISIALATLVSTTVNVLRARQIELRALINKESCELRLLRRAVFGMFGTRQHATRRARALALLCNYVEQLERECSVGAVIALEEIQLSGGIARNELDIVSEMLHGVDGAAASRQGSVGVAEGLIQTLNGHRSDRVALLLSVFPAIHWGVLIALSLSVIASFLLVSNQQVLQYLNSVQLRFMFAILVGVCSGTATLCLDLADPFRGSYSVAEAATQLEDIRLCLKEDVAEATAEAGEITSSIVHAILLGGSTESRVNESTDQPKGETSAVLWEAPEHFNDLLHSGNSNNRLENAESSDSKKGSSSSKETVVGGKWGTSPRRYGPISTLYFHLLTGPLGSNVRVLGDIIAWAASFVASQTRTFSQKVMAFSGAIGKKIRLRQRRPKLENE